MLTFVPGSIDLGIEIFVGLGISILGIFILLKIDFIVLAILLIDFFIDELILFVMLLKVFWVLEFTFSKVLFILLFKDFLRLFAIALDTLEICLLISLCISKSRLILPTLSLMHFLLSYIIKST